MSLKKLENELNRIVAPEDMAFVEESVNGKDSFWLMAEEELGDNTPTGNYTMQDRVARVARYGDKISGVMYCQKAPVADKLKEVRDAYQKAS